MKHGGEEERGLEKKLIRPVMGAKPVILNKSPYNPGEIVQACRNTVCVCVHVCVHCSGVGAQDWESAATLQ